MSALRVSLRLLPLVLVSWFSSSAISDDSVGFIPGEFSVNEVGAATYSIPIELPPGINAKQPNISITYDSFGSWFVTGLSSVSLCGKNKMDDDSIRAIKFDGSDPFCMDGSRLVLISGIHGQEGSVYVPDTSSNSRVTIRSAGTDNYFELRLQDGTIINYGVTSNSLAKNDDGETALWLISEERDLFNNSVEYNYNSGSGKPRISSVTYDQYLVEFKYEESTIRKEAYLFPDLKSVTDSLLSGINILDKNSNSLFWGYQVEYYEDQYGEKYIERVLKTKDNSVISSGEFGYSPGSSQKFAGTGTHLSQYGYNQGWSVDQHPRMLADVNGDGLDDIVGIANKGVIVALSKGDGTFHGAKHVSSKFGSNQSWNHNYHPRMMADVNGDGLADIVGFAHGGVAVALSRGDGTFSYLGVVLGQFGYNQGWSVGQHPRMMVDVDGDGFTDVVGFSNAGVVVARAKGDGTFYSAKTVLKEYGYNQGWSSYHPRMLRDVDGDGLVDIVGIANKGVIVALSKGGGTFHNAKHVLSKFGSNQSWSHDYHPRMMADVNGDRLADIVGFAHGGVVVALSRGDGTFNYRGVVLGKYGYNQGWSVGQHPRMMADVNGDGLADVVGFSNTGAIVALSKGDGTFQSTKKATGGFSYNGGWRTNYHLRMVTDLDGDGLADVVGFAHKGVVVSLSQYEKTRLTSISPSIGSDIEINYEKVTDGLVYSETPDFNHDAGLLQVTPRTVLVSELLKNDNLGNISKVSYKYSDYTMISGGLGSLGFRQIQQTDETTGIRTVTTYSQDWQKRTTGMVESSQTIAPDGTVLSEAVNQLENRFEGIHTDRYLPYIRATTSVQRDLDGSVINTTTLEHELNDNGWVEKDTTCVSGLEYMAGQPDDMSQNGITYCSAMANTESQKVTDYTYYPESIALDFAPLLERKTTSITIPNAPPFQPATETRVVAYDYYFNTGQLKSETIEPDNNDLWLTKTYTYHSSGQPLATTVSGADIETRTTSIEYNPITLLPVKKLNAKNHQTTLAYEDSRFPWLATKITAPDGNWVKTYFNSWGAKERTEKGHGATIIGWAETENLWCDGDALCEQDELFYTVSTASLGMPGYAFFDELGREVRRLSYGLHNGAVEEIEQRTGYNERGLVDWAGHPYYVNGGTEYGDTTQYDLLGRPTQITDSAGEISSIDYQGLTVVYTDPNSRVKTVIKNALGQQVEVRDNRNNPITYAYDAFGKMVYMNDNHGNETKIGFNVRGFKTLLDDPDQGEWVYEYDALGQLTHQTNANDQTTYTTYDVLGRMLSRTDYFGTSAAETSNWYYDDTSNSAAAIGKLTYITDNADYAKAIRYDDFGRANKTITKLEGEVYVSSTTYDSFGRVENSVFPTGYTVSNLYHDQLGGLNKVVKADGDTNPNNDYVFWEGTSASARGQAEQAMLGGFIQTSRTHNAATGVVENINASFGLTGTEYQNLVYQWDAVGNVMSFTDWVHQEVSETYLYDDLYRLNDVIASTGSVTSTQYDQLGNITSKTGVGNYSYDAIAVPSECGAYNTAPGPHAVRRITGAKANYYCYDSAGNMVKDKDRTINYTSFNKPRHIIRGSTTVNFSYGPDRSRYKRVEVKGGATSTTFYLGNYEKVIEGGTTKHKIVIGGVAQVIEEEGGSTEINYFLKDHLGSITAVVNQMGTAMEQMSFDAWGNRRFTNLMLLTDPYNYKNDFTDRGFTGHEHIDSVGLIHMNGRIYDPVIGRFLSADPLIQAPSNLQSLNRYSYVMNNPLSMIDPSGYGWVSKKWKAFKKRAKRFVAAAIGWHIGATTGAQFGYQYRKGRELGLSASDARKFGAKVTSIQTASTLASAVAGGWLSGLEFSATMYGSKAGAIIAEGVVRVLTHSTIGGITAKVSGGNFADGAAVSGSRTLYSYAMGVYIGDSNAAGFFKLAENPVLSVIEQAAVAAAVAKSRGLDSSGAAFNQAVTTALMAFLVNDSATHPSAKKGNGVLGYDNDGVPIFDESHPKFHHYYNSNSCLKTTSGCTLENAKAGLLRYPAPGASGQPITDEQTGFAVPVGTVRHEVYGEGGQIINVTLEGKHILHPGIVRRWVTEDAFSVTIHTYGEGTGIFPGPNEYFSEALWKRVDNNIFNYMSQQ